MLKEHCCGAGRDFLASVFIMPKEEACLRKRRASVFLGTALNIYPCHSTVFVLKYIENENFTKVKVSLAEVCVLNSFFFCFRFLSVLPPCMYVMYTTYGSDAHGGQKQASELLELKLHTVVSHHIGAGNC